MKKFLVFSLILLLALLPQGTQAASPDLYSPIPALFRTAGPDSLPYTPNWSGYSGQDEAHFGMRIAPAGDVDDNGFKDVLVSAPDYDGLGGIDSGRAYLYLGSASGLTLAWWADGDQANAKFGNQIAGIGDVDNDGYDDIAFSAYLYDNGQIDEGKVFVWYGGPGGLSCGAGCPVSAASADWSAESNQADARLNPIAGGDVDGDGFSDLIAGAAGYDYSPVADTGAVFVWRGGPAGLSVPGDPDHTYWTAYGNAANDQLGFRVAAVDVDKYGSMDVIASSIYFSHGETNEGAVFAWYTPLDVASGLPSSPSPSTANWKVESNQAGAYLGSAFNTAGDVNGDNFPDLIVSASYYDNGQTNEGLAFVFHGSVNGLPSIGAGWQAAASIANWTVESNHADGFLGTAVGAAGDVNADGYDDVIVGEPNYSVSGSNRGKAYVFYGSPGGLSCGAGCPLDAANANWGVEGEQDGALLGSAVTSAGDVNGNYVSDVFIGAPANNTDNTDIGKAFGYFGTSTENTPPVAVDDVAPPGSEDTVLNVAPAEGLLVNDYDPGGNHNRLVAIYDATSPPPAHGTVDIASDGGYIYTPNPNWFGTDYFRYVVSDGFAASPSAVVTVTIAPLNDAPVVSGFAKIGPRNTALPFAAADFTAHYSDVEGAPLAAVKILSLPANGELRLNGVLVAVSQEIPAANLGGLAFTPAAGWTGNTSFQWTASDGSAYASAPASVNISVVGELHSIYLPLVKR